jgi:hypothetical protein
MYTRNNSGPNTVLAVLQKVHQASLTHTFRLAPVVFLNTRKMLSIVGFFHGLHSDKVYEVSACTELCQTLWRNLGGCRQFYLFMISVSPQFLGWLILAGIRKIFESESRVDSLSECYDG